MKIFTAVLVRLHSEGGSNAGELGWRVLDVPFDVKQAFGKGGTVPVTGTVNGHSFRSSLFPRKGGPHFLLMNKEMQQGASATELGDPVEVTLGLDTAPRTIEIPALLERELDGAPELLDYYNSLSYSMRRYFHDYVSTPKSKASALKRARQLAEILLEMRDGEQVPPPYLQAEFAHNPKAKRGWEKMTPSQRRGHLWGVAYYRGPEARQKRLDKALAHMVKIGQ